MPEDIFLKTLQSRIDYRFETYRDFIISILKVTPDINDTAVLYRVKEEFDDLVLVIVVFIFSVYVL